MHHSGRAQECCKRKKASGAPTRQIVFVNGINTLPEDACKTMRQIANQTCARVIGVYNATGGFGQDLKQVKQDRDLVVVAHDTGRTPDVDGRNPAVDSMSDMMTEQGVANQSMEYWAHSQGGADTSLAAYSAKNRLGQLEGKAFPNLNTSLSNLSISSYGSAAPYWPQGPDYEHYIHMQDLVPIETGLGEDPLTDAATTGGSAKVIRFLGDQKQGLGVANDVDTMHRMREAGATLPLGASQFHHMDTTYLPMQQQMHRGDSCPADGLGTLGGPVVRA